MSLGLTLLSLFTNYAPPRGAARPRPWRARATAAWAELRPALLVFAVSRLALLAVGLLTRILLQPIALHANAVRLTNHAALNLWGAWDTGWYVALATHGYAAHPEPNGEVNWAFFPAYPFLSEGLARLTHLPVFIAMLALSNLAFLAALVLVRRLAVAEFDKPTADLSLALICATPASYIFSSAYTESLFLLAVSGCLLALKRRRWLAAGAFAGLAALTRNLGVALVLPIAVAAAPPLWALWREARSRDPLARRRLAMEAARVAAGLALPVAALGGFALFLYLHAGDPLAFVHAQAAWGRVPAFPLGPPFRYLLHPSRLADSDLLHFAACWTALPLLVVLGFMRRWTLFACALVLALAPLAGGVVSYVRYTLVMVPLFLAAARLLSDRPGGAFAAVTGLAMLNGFAMVTWTLGLWLAA